MLDHIQLLEKYIRHSTTSFTRNSILLLIYDIRATFFYIIHSPSEEKKKPIPKFI